MERDEDRYRVALETIHYYADHPKWGPERIRAVVAETLGPVERPPLVRRLLSALRPAIR
ncbi:hypothetical protein [Chthonobacter rhizosphaerae]|uniref:hypothetical protein n=1 Tax=Chthonobacter rhizosphaerae TaxID=2735553 RepID=UPI0015EEE5BB|nr:hypothetical protein [Chthonobacter rhizosphaerae]